MEFLLKIRTATRYDRARLQFSVVPPCEPAATRETVPYKGEGALRRYPRSFSSRENFRFARIPFLSSELFPRQISSHVDVHSSEPRSWILGIFKYKIPIYISIYPFSCWDIVDFLSWSFWLPSSNGNLCSVFKIYLGNRNFRLELILRI